MSNSVCALNGVSSAGALSRPAVSVSLSLNGVSSAGALSRPAVSVSLSLNGVSSAGALSRPAVSVILSTSSSLCVSPSHFSLVYTYIHAPLLPYLHPCFHTSPRHS